MSAARILDSELVMLIVIQNSFQGEGGGELMINSLPLLL